MLESHDMVIAGWRGPDSEWSVRYSPAPSSIEAMLDTIADLPCDDTKFLWVVDCRAWGEFIKSPVWWECDTACRFPMFSIVSSIVERHCFPSLSLFPFSLTLSLPINFKRSQSRAPLIPEIFSVSQSSILPRTCTYAWCLNACIYSRGARLTTDSRSWPSESVCLVTAQYIKMCVHGRAQPTK